MNHDKAAQLLEKLVKSPVGREVLGRKLNLKLVTPEEQKTAVEIPTVAVLVPCYHQPEPQMSDAMAKVYNYCREHGTCNIYTGPNVIGSSVVHWTRNFLTAELIKTQRPWTHVLYWDDDIVPAPESVAQMLSHKKDIVGGVCTKRIDPPIPNIRYWDEEAKGFREIFDWPEGKLIEVGGIGTGFMLVSRHALEQVADAYFRCLYEREVFGLSEDRAAKMMEARLKRFDDNANGHWFRFLPDLNGTTEYGEDMGFCFVARRYCNIPIYADTAVLPRHIGKYGYSVEDYRHYKGEVLAKAKAEGRYFGAPKLKVEQSEIEITA